MKVSVEQSVKLLGSDFSVMVKPHEDNHNDFVEVCPTDFEETEGEEQIRAYLSEKLEIEFWGKAKCPECGGTRFHIHEFNYYDADTSETDPITIDAHRFKPNGIDMIECANEDCMTDCTNLQFTFNIEFQ